MPASLPREVSVVANISGWVTHRTGRDVVELAAVAPNRGIIRTEAHLLVFLVQFNAFLQALSGAGARVL